MQHVENSTPLGMDMELSNNIESDDFDTREIWVHVAHISTQDRVHLTHLFLKHAVFKTPNKGVI